METEEEREEVFEYGIYSESDETSTVEEEEAESEAEEEEYRPFSLKGRRRLRKRRTKFCSDPIRCPTGSYV